MALSRRRPEALTKCPLEERPKTLLDWARQVDLQPHTVALWYGRTNRRVEIGTGTAVWYHAGLPPVPIRWLLVRDPTGELETHAFLATNLDVTPQDMLQWFVRRWQIEVTFEEVRAHLGVETQRQWSDRAILRTTPTLLGLFSLVCLWAHDLYTVRAFAPRTAAWYPKAHLTFSDTIAAVRRQICGSAGIWPVATRYCTTRIVLAVATPTRARSAITMWAGRMKAVALPRNIASAHEGRRAPSSATA